MPESPNRLAARLRQEGLKTGEFFRLLPDAERQTTVYPAQASEDGREWTAHHILAHCVAAEAGMQALVRNVLDGGSGAPEDLNLDAYNARKVAALESLSTTELLERFAALRQATAELVEGLSVEQLQLPGRHPWLGVVPIVEIVKLLYVHNQIHQRDIRRGAAAE